MVYGEIFLLGDVYDDIGDGVLEVGDEVLINFELLGFGNGLFRIEFVMEVVLF